LIGFENSGHGLLIEELQKFNTEFIKFVRKLKSFIYLKLSLKIPQIDSVGFILKSYFTFFAT
jgi:hypothetical protein